ncbi:hypothetical protein MFLAVUS_009120 [Mucor flavus]|uniref:Homeobox domain-containing protein n=1 Tax=Mucor flavus TaxID=439312 RepID=A0ABP9Z907_9FUNG
MNQVYGELQEWKIPSSNEYISDSESPLSLLPSPKTPSSSPDLTEEDMPDTSLQLQYLEKDPLKVEETLTSNQQDHIIASNETIACIRPQSVSIVWSNNHKTTIHISPVTNEPEPTAATAAAATVAATADTSTTTTTTTTTATTVQKKRRTTTSYDVQTSLYLKSVFFEVYSKQKKLTKEQRMQVQQRTGLPSRNITYWFSNHKRRFKNTLQVYRQAVEESHGAVGNYRDFIRWRRNHDLPDQVTQAELA